ncbi:MAG TPA: hypothetical protein IAD33_08785 [Candidatus Scatomorpha gallistercoris]|nr:hypothetical protein [Candidatus Scatomorpha gallistercoris]
MVKRLFLLLLALVFTLCVSGCGIDSEEALIREIIEMREIPEGSSGEVIHQEQEGDYERMLVLFHGGTYLEDRVCMARVGDGTVGNFTGPWLASVTALRELDDGFIEYSSGSSYLLVVTNPEAARMTLTDLRGYGTDEEITSLPFVYEIPGAYRGVYVCRVLDAEGNVLYER